MGFTGFLRRGLKVFSYGATGATLIALGGVVLYLDNRPDLDIWHLVELEEEFSERNPVDSFAAYLDLEERLFNELDDKAFADGGETHRYRISRYHRGSLSDPNRWDRNWNRSFVLDNPSPRAGVLLLHGMSDSPYSLRHLGQGLHAAGAFVVGLRLPGHGTAPSELLDVTWQDMAAAVRLAMDHLAEKAGDRPLYIIGYSNGAALAVHYALQAVQDPGSPSVARLVLVSPAIGVSKVAALAAWQSRIGSLLGLEKLQWNDIQPEYDPFKYGSFPVNAGDAVHRLTGEIQRGLTDLSTRGRLAELPPILAFQSVIDATVSTPALIQGLFARLPAGGHELVLFDINHDAAVESILAWQPVSLLRTLQSDAERLFRISLVTNRDGTSPEVVVWGRGSEKNVPADVPLGLAWPDDVHSLSHIALPFPPDDVLYGRDPGHQHDVIHLGALALRGERNTLRVPATLMLRLRWNPFYPYLETRILDFLSLHEPRPD